MFRPSRILCAVDFSDGSRRALDYAVALARRLGAEVSVLYVHAMAVPVPVSGYAEVMRPLQLTDLERSRILGNLADFVAESRAAGASIDTVFEEALAAGPTIVESASREAADLLVLGTHGRTGFNRLVLGSVADRVMQTAPCPVLVVPPGARDAASAAFHRIVCAVDFSPVSARALEIASALAVGTGVRLTVMHVLELPGESFHHGQPVLAGYRAGRFEQARTALDEAVSAAVAAGCPVDALLVAGKPHVEIQRIAAEQAADLLVVGTQGLGALDPVTFGTTAHRVVRQASCPVLTVRTPAS